MNIKIGIAAHKVYRMPSEKSYLPIQVGAHGKDDIGYTRDDIGDNISKKSILLRVDRSLLDVEKS